MLCFPTTLTGESTSYLIAVPDILPSIINNHWCVCVPFTIFVSSFLHVTLANKVQARWLNWKRISSWNRRSWISYCRSSTENARRSEFPKACYISILRTTRSGTSGWRIWWPRETKHVRERRKTCEATYWTKAQWKDTLGGSERNPGYCSELEIFNEPRYCMILSVLLRLMKRLNWFKLWNPWYVSFDSDVYMYYLHTFVSFLLIHRMLLKYMLKKSGW